MLSKDSRSCESIRSTVRRADRCGESADVADAIPELLRLCDLEVRIPRMEVVSLEKLAARDRKSVDAVLAAAELRDLVSAQSEWLASVIPGFASALAWPY